jgi:hypothetical protein
MMIAPAIFNFGLACLRAVLRILPYPALFAGMAIVAASNPEVIGDIVLACFIVFAGGVMTLTRAAPSLTTAARQAASE